MKNRHAMVVSRGYCSVLALKLNQQSRYTKLRSREIGYKIDKSFHTRLVKETSWNSGAIKRKVKADIRGYAIVSLLIKIQLG